MSEKKLTLTYMNSGGRALPARLAFAIGGIDFVDERPSDDTIEERYKAFPNNWGPALSNVPGYGDAVINQSKAIARYATTVAGLEPTDPLQAALIEEVVQNLDEMESPSAGLFATFGLEGDEQKEGRAKFLAGPAAKWFGRIEAMFQGAPFFIGDKPTRADLWVFTMVGFLSTLDHVDPAYFAAYPKVSGMCAALKAIPAVAAFFEKNPKG
jgi:glutathione S-transferase